MRVVRSSCCEPTPQETAALVVPWHHSLQSIIRRLLASKLATAEQSRYHHTLSGARGAKQLVVVTTHRTFSAPHLSTAALTPSTSVTTASPCKPPHGTTWVSFQASRTTKSPRKQVQTRLRPPKSKDKPSSKTTREWYLRRLHTCTYLESVDSCRRETKGVISGPPQKRTQDAAQNVRASETHSQGSTYSLGRNFASTAVV